MPETAVSVTRYYAASAALIALTALTVGLSFAPIPGVWHIVIGLAIALTNAVIVLSFFMDTWIRSPVVWSVVIVSSFWLGILLVLTFSDYFTRGMIPFTPGH
jgi:cytochrome c oxidase subunit 4